MALPKKGSRRIVVDGTGYRWRIRSQPTYSQALAEGELSFAVELELQGRSVLLVQTTELRPDNWMIPIHTFIGSAVVARAIREALHNGWRPRVKGQAFILERFTISASRKSHLGVN